MKCVVLLVFEVLMLAPPLLCCQSTKKTCYVKKIIPLPLTSLEEHKKKYQENIQKWGQPTPSVVGHHEADRNLRPNCSTCGRRVADENIRKIIHGQTAPEMFYPWQVLVRGKEKYCGGVLIAPQWILTAAHCIGTTVYILLGTSNLVNHSSHKIVRMAAKEIVHEDYRSMHNDIALIKMNNPVIYNDYTRPICLPNTNTDFSSSHECYLTGWGYTDKDTKQLSSKLQEVKVHIMSHSECFIRWILATKVITAGNLCTELDLASPNSGACFGDSGGPLACRLKDSYYLAGIASMVQSKCRKTILPDLFVRVSYYRNWIEKKIRENDPM